MVVPWPLADLNQLDPKELLASGLVPSGPLFEKVLADRDRLLDVIALERAEKWQLQMALDRSHRLIKDMENESNQMGTRAL
jgi:hypothetical protein